MNSLEDIEVSIILPTLNEGENLETLVPEIISNIPSSIINYEILIIDDNSSDNTHQIVDQLNSQNKRLIYLKEMLKHLYQCQFMMESYQNMNM